MKERILLVGGGTGGHIIPLVAVAEQLQILSKQKNLDLEIQLMGDGQLLADSAKELNISYTLISSAKWRRYFSLLNITDLFKLPLGLVQTAWQMWRFLPDVIFSKGGYASVIPVLIGKLFFIPIVIHESDAIPGKANLYLSHIAKKIFIASPAASAFFPPSKTQVVGRPTRQAIIESGLIDKKTALTSFTLGTTMPTVFITGASQGAKIINDVLVLSLIELTKKFQIIHQCGTSNFKNVQERLDTIIKEEQGSYSDQLKERYRLLPVLSVKEMANAYSASDVIVSRASSAIYEFALLGKPTIVIPLGSAASDHQTANAQELAKFGGIIITEQNLTGHILMFEIQQAYDKRDELSKKIRAFTTPDASLIIAQYLIDRLM